MSSRNKGKFLEEIIYKIYRKDGVIVKKNALLTPVFTRIKSRKKREIDILLVNKVANIEVKIAIECKNEKKPIGTPQIDAFIGKLCDVGIPAQLGIYISASGYTKGAIDRARVAGIKTLVFKEITGENLNDILNEAIQSVIYLLLDVKSISIINNVQNPADDIHFFYDEKGNICGTTTDLVWVNWKKGHIPEKIGHHQIELIIPDKWNQIIKGKIEPILSAEAEVIVYGLLIMMPGTVSDYALLEQDTNEINRRFVEASFDSSQGGYAIKVFDSEDLLKERLQKYRIKISFGRKKLPRIKFGAIYWPPSLHTINQLSKLSQLAQSGEVIDPRQYRLEDIEGSDISAIWEPIYSRYLELFNKKCN